MERETVNILREVAMKALSFGREEVRLQVKSPKRCNWWNRGYCKEQNACLFSHQGGDCEEHLLSERCTSQGTTVSDQYY